MIVVTLHGCVAVDELDDVTVIPALPNTNVSPRLDAAGTVTNCSGLGRHVTQFWVQNRSSSAPSGLSAFSQITADCRAKSSDNKILLYREQCSDCNTWLDGARAQSIVDSIAPSYESLKQIYGNGNFPDVQANGGKIIILATDIQDDYGSSFGQQVSAYVSGYFAPRDLFADTYTSALAELTKRENTGLALVTDATTIVQRKGHSNENNLIYLDLNPLLSGDASDGATTAIRQANALEVAKETVLHELSHLFTYNHRNRQRRIAMHDLWITEGTAEIGPAILAGRLRARQDRLRDWGNPIVQAYLGNSRSLSAWGTEAATIASGADASLQNLANYAQAYLFFSYVQTLTSPFGTTRAFFNDLMGSSDPSAAGLDAILGRYASSNFRTAFTDFIVSIAVYSRGSVPVRQYLLSNAAGSEASGTLSGDTTPTFASRMQRLSFAGSGIKKVGEGGVAFTRAGLPFSFGDGGCLPPTSYRYSRLTLQNSGTTIQFPAEVTGGAASQSLTISGFDSRLKLFTLREAAFAGDNPSSLRLTEFDLSSGSATLFVNTACGASNTCKLDIHLILVNPEPTGDCLTAPTLPSNPRSVTAWIGGGTNSWNKTPGTDLGYGPGYFFRQSGLDAVRDPGANNVYGDSDDQDFIFVTDRAQHTVSKFNFRTGQFMGRLGARPGLGNGSVVPCTDDGSDFFYTLDSGTVSGNCRSLFNTPNSVKVVRISDNAHPYYPYYLLVADSGNRRIVRRTHTGSYAGALGHSAHIDGFSPVGVEFSTSAQNNLDPWMFDFPTELEIGNCDASLVGVVPAYNHTDFQCAYIYDSNKGRVIRRLLDLRGAAYDVNLDGKYLGMIGQGRGLTTNGVAAYGNWNTDTGNISGGNGGNAQGNLFSSTQNRDGLAIDSSYLYASEGEAHRITRIPLSGNMNTRQILGANGSPGWHTTLAQSSGTARYYFNTPADIEVGNTYLYVADSGNYRVVRVLKGSPAGQADWSYIGSGFTEWESTDYNPAYFDFATNCSTNPAPLAVDMCQPASLAGFNLNLDFITASSPMFGTGKTSIDYLLLSNVYHNRASRWNLDCAADNADLIACRDF